MKYFAIILILVGFTVTLLTIPQVFAENEQKPLKLDDFASELWYDNEFIVDGTILDIRGYDKPERIYNIQINSFFKPTEGTGPKLITVYGSPHFYSVEGDRGIFFIKKEDAKWTFGRYAAKVTADCPSELMYHYPRLIDPPLTRGMHPVDYNLLVDCYPSYYQKYLPQYMKAHGATEFPSPRTQAINGVLVDEIVCNGNLEMVIRYNGSPACVKSETKQKLIERGWIQEESPCHGGCGGMKSFDNYIIDCNKIDGKKELECFSEAFESCEKATMNYIIYTIEGDPGYFEGSVEGGDSCYVSVVFDNTQDRFSHPDDRTITETRCTGIEFTKHTMNIGDCDDSFDYQLNYQSPDWALDEKCQEIGGVWDYAYHNCAEISNLEMCEDNGGNLTCMSYEQMENGRDVCHYVCNFDVIDRK